MRLLIAQVGKIMIELKVLPDRVCECGKLLKDKKQKICWECAVKKSGMLEDEITKAMETVINQIMREITPFGFYRGVELKQQCFVFGVEAMTTGKFNETKSLGAWLRKCIINRVISLSRDKYTRNEPPCNKCPFFDKELKKSQSGCMAFNEKMKCEKFKNYEKRNKSKRDIMNLKSKIPLFEDTIGSDYRPFVDVDNRDYIAHISKFLTNSCKNTLRDIFAGKSVSKKRLDKLREEVGHVLKSTT